MTWTSDGEVLPSDVVRILRGEVVSEECRRRRDEKRLSSGRPEVRTTEQRSTSRC